MHLYPQLATKLYNTPLMIAESKFTVIEGVFRAWESGRPAPIDEAAAAAFEAKAASSALMAVLGPQRKYEDKPYQMTDSGIAVIPVMGTLVQRASGLDALSGLTSYAKLDRLFAQAEADPDVKGILQWYDTPGGEVAGLFALGDKRMAARGGKPSLAYIDEQALSAGYYLAATADEIWMPTTGLAGSIGSIFMHREQSAKNAADGYVYTLIRSGAAKAEGNPHEPLSPGALQWFQGEADRLRGLFAGHVDAARGLTAGLAQASEARVYAGPAAISQQLVDTIGSFGDAIARLESLISARAAGSSASRGASASAAAVKPTASTTHHPEAHMSANAQGDTLTPDQLAALKAAAHAEGLKAGAQAERTRIGAILTADEAKGRAQLAQTFALESDLPPETAKKLLAASPVVAAAAAKADPLAAAMAGISNPNLGAAGGGDEQVDSKATASSLAQQILNAGKPGKA